MTSAAPILPNTGRRFAMSHRCRGARCDRRRGAAARLAAGPKGTTRRAVSYSATGSVPAGATMPKFPNIGRETAISSFTRHFPTGSARSSRPSRSWASTRLTTSTDGAAMRACGRACSKSCIRPCTGSSESGSSARSWIISIRLSPPRADDYRIRSYRHRRPFLRRLYVAALAGAEIDLPDGTSRNFRDNRFSAAILLSAQGRDQQGLREGSWDGITGPMLNVTGTLDGGAKGQDWRWKVEPYEFAPPPDKYLALLVDADHYLGGLARPDQSPVPAQRDAVFQLTLAFLDAYVAGSALAKSWLAGVTDRLGDCRLQFRQK